MTEKQVRELNVGDRVTDILGDLLEIVSINGLLYELKYVINNNTLSKGSIIKVPSHFKYCELA